MYLATAKTIDGTPMIVMRPRMQNTTSHDGQMKLLVYTIERCLAELPPDGSVPPDQEKTVWCIDYKGWSLSNAPPMKTSLETLNILQNHYPERLKEAICYNPPRIFGVFWKMVSPFIDANTVKKVLFVYSKDKAKGKGLEAMKERFDMEKLESVGEVVQT